MIRGLSGTLLSADALLAAGFSSQDGQDNNEAKRALRILLTWRARLERSGGPAWTARQVFDEVAAPLCSALGLRLVPSTSTPQASGALLQAHDDVVAVVV